MTANIRTTVIGSYPVPDWLRALPNSVNLRDAVMVVMPTANQLPNRVLMRKIRRPSVLPAGLAGAGFAAAGAGLGVAVTLVGAGAGVPGGGGVAPGVGLM